MKIKRFFALLCVAVLSVSLLCSCNKKNKNNDTPNTTNTHVSKPKKEKDEESQKKLDIELDKYKQKINLNDDSSTPNIKDYDFEKAYNSTSEEISSNIDEKDHTYVGGICSICGKADKSNPYLALSTLIKNNGVKSNQTEFSINNDVGESTYSITYNEKNNDITLIKNELQGKKRNIVVLLPKGTDTLIINYIDNNKNDCSCILSAKSFTYEENIKLDTFNGTETQKAEAETYTKDSCTILMTVLNNFLKDSNSGLTLKNFGFASYVPYGLETKK